MLLKKLTLKINKRKSYRNYQSVNFVESKTHYSQKEKT